VFFYECYTVPLTFKAILVKFTCSREEGNGGKKIEDIKFPMLK
jgi:hypothetical protein